MFSKLGSWFTELFENIGNWFSQLFTNLGNWFSELWTNIDNGLRTLSNNLVNSITSVSGWLDNNEKRRREEEEERKRQEEEESAQQEDEGASAINDGVSGITSKFNFVDNIKTNVNDMINIITDETKTPKFELNVNSKWYQGKVTVVDFGWYDDYREFGDNVICMFCYLSFLWNIFKRLPDIIQGAGASSYSVDMVNDIYAHSKTGFGRASNLFRR